MKILTLNTHSLLEEHYEEKLQQFVEVIEKELPAIFALQEVNQTISAKEITCPRGYVPCETGGTIVKEDNHAYQLAQKLYEKGIEYTWSWISVKVGYDKYDEGLAVFSRYPIAQTVEFCISKTNEYRNWKTRKVLGIKTGRIPTWYFSVHMGWWDDIEDPFAQQWDTFCKCIDTLLDQQERCYILGDFNSPSNIPHEGYDYVIASGWYDTWTLAEKKDCGITVGKVIDGWRARMEKETVESGMRIDFIWCNETPQIHCSQVICNGDNYPVVSDHYGVMIEILEN